jgi:hypothetical protein
VLGWLVLTVRINVNVSLHTSSKRESLDAELLHASIKTIAMKEIQTTKVF